MIPKKRKIFFVFNNKVLKKYLHTLSILRNLSLLIIWCDKKTIQLEINKYFLEFLNLAYC